MMLQPEEPNLNASLRQLCETAQKIDRSSSADLLEHMRYYINFYVQHKKSSEEFFICLCEHAILHKLFTAPAKSLSSLAVLQLFHLLISNSNKPNDLVYIFSQPIVHEYLFERLSIHKEREDTIEYYVQLLKTIIMKCSSEGNEFLIKLFCNKRFPTFPLLTVCTVLGVSQEVDDLVKITAQQCVLLLINLINSMKTGLVYLNELQMVVYFYQLTRQMFDEKGNQDKQGSLRYLIDLTFTLRNNQTSRFLLFNLLVNNIFFKYVKQPTKIMSFIREFRQHSAQCQEVDSDMTEDIIATIYRIFSKYYLSQFINFTYFNAQRIIPSINIRPQPKLFKFFADRCKKIDDYLVNEGDYDKSEKGNECLIDEWLEFNNHTSPSPVKPNKKNAFVDFFSSTEDAVDRYIHDVMTMAGLEVEKLKSPIIKLTFSSNFKTSLFLAESISTHIEQKVLQDFCKDDCWKLQASEGLFTEIYLTYLLLQANQTSTIILQDKMEGENNFLQKVQPVLATLIAQQLSKESVNLSKNYLLLLYKLILKLNLRKHLQPLLIEKILMRLFELQKMIGELMFVDQTYSSFLRYILKNQERPFVREKIDIQGLKSGKLKLSKPKEKKIEHLLFYYEILQRFLDPSLKTLNEFVEDYWRMGYGGHEGEKGREFKPLMACRDASSNFLQVYPTSRFDFQVRYRSKSEEKAKFILKETDFPQNEPQSNLLNFAQFKGEIRMESLKCVRNFRKDVWAIRQSRKQIFRQAALQYMPFIYESIEVKYRNHKFEATPNTPQ